MPTKNTEQDVRNGAIAIISRMGAKSNSWVTRRFLYFSVVGCGIIAFGGVARYLWMAIWIPFCYAVFVGIYSLARTASILQERVVELEQRLEQAGGVDKPDEQE